MDAHIPARYWIPGSVLFFALVWFATYCGMHWSELEAKAKARRIAEMDPKLAASCILQRAMQDPAHAREFHEYCKDFE